WPNAQVSAHRFHAAHVDLGHAGFADVAATERVLMDGNDGVAYVRVPIDGDVLHVDDRSLVDDHVVDDARPAPSDPMRMAADAWPTPPGDDRLAPAQRHPAHERSADGDAHTRRREERDERRRVDRPHDDRTRSPGPVAVDVDPTPMVVGRPTPRRIVDPRPAGERAGDPVAPAARRP